ncbi:MAG: LON peptidase substrate-binding domain-containing protein, partial [Spirochaetaceae bacterium]|nr:LON peptidase substrate-binding domain-containing protein [Spirochaetaceae bacterium]
MKLSRSRPEDRGERPLIPLRELVVFPHNVIPFFVGRPASLKALNEATSGNREIFLAFQKTATEDPGPDDIHPIGTVARVVQVLKLPDGNMRVLVEGRYRACLKKIRQKKDVTWGQYRMVRDEAVPESLKTLIQAVKDDFQAYSKLRTKKLAKEAVSHVIKADTPEKLVGHICSALDIEAERKIPFL